MKKLTLIAAVVAMAGFASAQLLNPGFETGDTTGWTETLSGASATVQSTYVNSGNYALAIDSTGAGQWNSPNVWQSFAAAPGDTASMSGWMLQTAIGSLDWATIKLEWKDINGNNIEPGVGVLSGAIDGTGQPYVGVVGLPQIGTIADQSLNTWIPTSLSAVAPAGTVAANFYLLNVNGGGGVTHYFDDISASVIPEPATIGLVGIAGLGMYFARRRRI